MLELPMLKTQQRILGKFFSEKKPSKGLLLKLEKETDFRLL